MLNIIDIFLIVLALLFIAIGFIRGFISEVLSFFSWIIAGFIAFKFYPVLSKYLSGDRVVQVHANYLNKTYQNINLMLPQQYQHHFNTYNIISFVLILVVSFVILFFIKFILQKIITFLHLGILNKILGGAIGFLKYLAIAGSIIYLLSTYTNIANLQIWNNSKAIPIIINITHTLVQYL
ncbi:MAG: CvpA family protein [Psittacicella sp.]